MSYPDLLATKAIVDDLRAVKMTKKGVIVFNEVRKPYNKTYYQIKDLFFANYQDIKKADTELSNLVGFGRILAEAIQGQAKEEIVRLTQELKIR